MFSSRVKALVKLLDFGIAKLLTSESSEESAYALRRRGAHSAICRPRSNYWVSRRRPPPMFINSAFFYMSC